MRSWDYCWVTSKEKNGSSSSTSRKYNPSSTSTHPNFFKQGHVSTNRRLYFRFRSSGPVFGTWSAFLHTDFTWRDLVKSSSASGQLSARVEGKKIEEKNHSCENRYKDEKRRWRERRLTVKNHGKGCSLSALSSGVTIRKNQTKTVAAEANIWLALSEQQGQSIQDQLRNFLPFQLHNTTRRHSSGIQALKPAHHSWTTRAISTRASGWPSCGAWLPTARGPPRTNRSRAAFCDVLRRFPSRNPAEFPVEALKWIGIKHRTFELPTSHKKMADCLCPF